ncbi:MAG: hypothetical protein NWE93_05665 [Candidatus Bathyarchaeota archaeon]|nr:hypothetical protein [Candidatus Bathyarchaeota archaeon]
MAILKALKDKVAYKRTAPATFIVLNTFVWYLLTYFVFTDIVSTNSEKVTLLLMYYIGIAITAIIGSKLFPRMRNKALYVWLFMGVLATFLLNFISSTNLLASSGIAFFFGASIGIGLPSCLSYFADVTTIETRGLLGGIIWGLTGFAVLCILASLISLQVETFVFLAVLTAWRFLGALISPIMNRHYKPEIQKTTKAPSYISILRNRQILLYLFPWIMFSIINFAESPLVEAAFPTMYSSMQVFEYALAGIFAIIGGALSDIIGRKRIVIVGFVMLGIEYAVLSAFSGSQTVAYLFLILDGITWGLLFSVFFTVIWGDLGERYEKEKFYTVGGMPFLLSTFLTIIVTPYADSIPLSTAFSIASFFLFLAVIPLMYAPETLPEKTMKDRELKSYIEKAQKMVTKETKKPADGNQEDQSQEPEKQDDDSAEYEEARKLAEKYY